MKKILALFLLSLSTQCLAIEVAPGVELLYEKEELTGNLISGHIEKLKTARFFGYWLGSLYTALFCPNQPQFDNAGVPLYFPGEQNSISSNL